MRVSSDTRRLVSCIAAIVAVPFFLCCGIGHLCIEGHFEHPPYHWLDYASDITWIILLPIAFVFSFRSNIAPRKLKTAYIAVLLFVMALRVMGEGIISLAGAVLILSAILIAAMASLTRRRDQSGSGQEEASPLIVIPMIAAAVHFALLGCFGWRAVSRLEPGASFVHAIQTVLMWPFALSMWAPDTVGPMIGLVMSFLWVPAITCWVTWAVLHRRKTESQGARRDSAG